MGAVSADEVWRDGLRGGRVILLVCVRDDVLGEFGGHRGGVLARVERLD